MIVPHSRLLFWTAAVTLPAALIGAAVPEAVPICLLAAGVFGAAAFTYALSAGRRLEGIGIDMPPNVVMQVVASEPGVKGDTASGATKPATLTTGATVNVPLFIKEGEWIKIDTSSGQYLERVNK